MATENPILRAKNVLGIGQKDDYILKPALHAEDFKSAAPALASILTTSEIAITIEEYEAKDREALAAQKEFRRIFNRANLLVLCTAVLSAMVLTTGVLSALIADGLEKFCWQCSVPEA
jgi:hypothetical protein